MAKTGGGRDECAHDSHLPRAVDARHAARSYEAGLEPCVNAISTLATRPRCVRKTRFRSRARASERPRAIAHTRKAKPGCFRFEAEPAAPGATAALALWTIASGLASSTTSLLLCAKCGAA